MKRFAYECPVCRVPVRGRTFRRRLHDLEIPRTFNRNARRRYKQAPRKVVRWKASPWAMPGLHAYHLFARAVSP